MREFIDGAEAIARAAVDAGCDFFAGYPITPATPILLHLSRALPRVGGVAIQAEDEIASMGLCIGAALSGRRVMTATSGPGISLYSENIGLAIMAEVPMVIVDAQRMGPATGGATAAAQGDVQFLRWGTSGGYPVIVLAPSDAAECYALTHCAFELAERFRAPVFLATDKETVLTRTTVPHEAVTGSEPVERPGVDAAAEYVPFAAPAPDGVPVLSPYGGAHLLRVTTSTHDEAGYLTKDPTTVDKLNRRLAEKIEAHVDDFARVDVAGPGDADVAIVSYGITSGAAEVARDRAGADGLRVRHASVKTLWPLPERKLRAALDGVRAVVVPELNLGQYRREVERLVPAGVAVTGVNRVDGGLISPAEILAAVRAAVAKKGHAAEAAS